ncbi:NADPH:quinone oxidoreductase family protein [Microbacterium sp. M3]|uniref:NADPH:quinone oxidoreductase family protein n=1 Tax=Microbacterium arthrosphaerae TaxID=792652 RepID=A0ABU4H516_9MICO|nr:MULTISPECIES: NADPH:quinone oxidoreductase family protein [Microbacterium]MDW4574446.1 NADPH:quinone oxidoreductase family protein [Microbacterium arthrosphaerae]MDW7608301.1 NADPH:quinone oxidoreductase family protein [Microbacterium sp. M3]
MPHPDATVDADVAMTDAALPLPESMRAWRVTTLGEPAEALSLDVVPVPVPGPGEVLVRVRAVAANFPDVLLCRGQYQVKPELPFSPGIELVGVVAALGPGASGIAVGERVVGSKIGVLAEYAVLPASDVWAAPGSLTDAQAAGLTVAYQTAWFGLHRRAALQPGEWLLVHAAAGGVGLAAVQLGIAAGARVIGVVGSDAKAAVAREAGADVVLVRGVDDLVAGVKAATSGHGADVVFDPVGGAAFEASTKCIAFEGRIVVVGFAGGAIQALPAGHVLVKNYSVLGLHWGLYPGARPDLIDVARTELTRLADEGAVRPVVDHAVPFERAPEALEALASGSTVGRVVIEVAS